jgi:hypothetical protein
MLPDPLMNLLQHEERETGAASPSYVLIGSKAKLYHLILIYGTLRTNTSTFSGTVTYFTSQA